MGIINGISPSRIEKIISDFEIGEEGWTVPEALELCQNSKGYLNLNSPVSSQINLKDNMTMYIKRTGIGKDDFSVRVNDVENYKWKINAMDEDTFENVRENPAYAILEYNLENSTESQNQMYKKENEPKTASKKKKKFSFLESLKTGSKLKDEIKKIESEINNENHP